MGAYSLEYKFHPSYNKESIMGTRSLTIVNLFNKRKVSQYHQFDGYPECAGVGILEFFRNLESPVEFEHNLKKCKLLPSHEWDGTPSATKQYDSGLTRFPAPKVLEYIRDNSDDEILLEDSYRFAGDGLFCEWVYEISIYKNAVTTLRVYKGGKGLIKEGERFYDLKDVSNYPYRPVRLVIEYAWTDEQGIPDDESFLKAVKDNMFQESETGDE